MSNFKRICREPEVVPETVVEVNESGALILVLPADALASLFDTVRFGEFYYLYVTISLVLGLYLAWAGFCQRG